MIKAENVVKTYNSQEVLKGISLEIYDGEFVVILGASGSGKSTLLSILSGLEKADGGHIECNGVCLDALKDDQLTAFRKEQIGFIFQQYYLLSHLNVEDNVKLGANLANNKDYRQIIEAVGLKDKLKSKPSALSGGEQQRVCIARALAKNPKILFLDEPTGALDEVTGREVLDYISKLQKERGFTVVMVTHNVNIADMAEKVVKMNSGKIVEIYQNSARKSAYEIGW
ncbi:MAG: ABC transporter ATP-binding protein [Clostridia bacterium]|nr:ABC transporter ATP-binding protein [Clostridia bacterium]MDE7078950.1 ABC transporter ATP-binding protein [Clostridia bacterium]